VIGTILYANSLFHKIPRYVVPTFFYWKKMSPNFLLSFNKCISFYLASDRIRSVKKSRSGSVKNVSRSQIRKNKNSNRLTAYRGFYKRLPKKYIKKYIYINIYEKYQEFYATENSLPDSFLHFLTALLENILRKNYCLLIKIYLYI